MPHPELQRRRIHPGQVELPLQRRVNAVAVPAPPAEPTAAAFRPHLRRHILAIELHQRIPLLQAHHIVPRRKLRLRSRYLKLAAHMAHPAQSHTPPRISICVQAVVIACIGKFFQSAVQKIRHHPILKHISKGLAEPGQETLHAVHAVQRLARKLRQTVNAAVMLQQILHEQGRAAIVRNRVARLIWPEVQLRFRMPQKYVHEARIVTCKLRRHFRHPFVHPHILAQVQVPVHRMLELMRQHAEILSAARSQPVAVHHNHLALVAARMSRAGIRIARREVAGRRDERRMQHRQARIAVNARLPYIADGIHYHRANLPLEYFRRPLKLLRREFRILIRVPVSVIAHRKQPRLYRIDAPLDEVRHEELLPMSHIAAVRVRRQRAR